MPISMTGYGRAQLQNEEWEITAMIQSVNHRFLDVHIRLDSIYSYLEVPLRDLLKKHCSRGKIDITIDIKRLNTKEALKADEQTLAFYFREAERIRTKYRLNDGLSINTLIQLPGIFKPTCGDIEESAVFKLVLPVFKQALSSFLEMRQKEGGNLARDMSLKLDQFVELLSFLENNAQTAENDYLLKLKEKISSLLDLRPFDESRVLTEVAILAEKSSVDEETVRLRSHVNQFRALLQQDLAGRKGEFILQEMNRETNTIGSKVTRLSFTNTVIQMKSILEKIREQIQNVE